MTLEQSSISTMKDEGNNEKYINRKQKLIKFKNIRSAFIKRTIDIIGGLIGCLMLIPITLFVAIANLILENKLKVFFVQERIGKNGKIFKMYKYRTMLLNAEEILNKHIEEKDEIGREYLLHKKIKNDPRITKVGKFLRKTSIDEFPQFINVIKGEMSIVGPRPYLLREKEDMEEYYEYIIQMKPGITGPWQVAGRNNLEFEDRLKLDKEYCEKRGNKRDIKILFKTIEKVLKKEGAI